MCISCVGNDQIMVYENFGKFSRLAQPGLNFYNCCIGECPAGSVSTRVEQLDVKVETKTKDNVFVHVCVAVQYEVNKEDIYNAFYKLANPRQQMTAYVFDVVRSTVPKIDLDAVFDSKDEIATSVRNQLLETMGGYGFRILTALVTDLTPNETVKRSMNEINAAARARLAATERAEADKILVVKAAEADAESKYLQGVGISRQRQAIVGGLQESVALFTNNISDVGPKDVLQLMMMTQYMDMLRDVGASNTTVFIPHNPSGVADISSQLRDGLMQASSSGPVGVAGSQYQEQINQHQAAVKEQAMNRQ